MATDAQSIFAAIRPEFLRDGDGFDGNVQCFSAIDFAIFGQLDHSVDVKCVTEDDIAFRPRSALSYALSHLMSDIIPCDRGDCHVQIPLDDGFIAVRFCLNGLMACELSL